MDPSRHPPASPCPRDLSGPCCIRFGEGFRLRRLLVILGWLLVPLLLVTGAGMRDLVHLITAILLVAVLWPITLRSGEILWEGSKLSVRRYFRFVPLDPAGVEAAVVTPPVFMRQSLVLKLKHPLHLSRYVYCRLAPGTICDAWALVHQRNWEPRGDLGRSES